MNCMKFEHEFDLEDDNSGVYYTENFCIDDENLEVHISEEEGVWLSGDKKGWLKFAKIIIEMVYRDDPPTHQHFPANFKLISEKKPNFSIEYYDNKSDDNK